MYNCIGITYDLKDDYLREGFTEEQVAEFDSEETIVGIENAINNCGFKTERIGNVKNLIKLLNEGKTWKLIFNICEGMYGLGREAQVPAILEAFQIPYTFSDTLTLSLTLHKGYTKQIIADYNIPTAPFAIINDLNDLKNIQLNYPLFIKPAAEGTGKGITSKSIINNFLDLEPASMEMLSKFKQPILVEEFLPGREFTVGVVGNGDKAKVVGVMEVVYLNKNNQIYSYETKANYENLVNYIVPEKKIIDACTEYALKIWKVLNCKDAGRIDFRMDQHDVPNFIEINPLAGLNHIHSDLPILSRLNGISFQMLIEMILEESINRNQIKL